MAKQISAIKFTGTMGNMVGSKGLDGKVIIREKPASVANPQTEDQMAQRARFKLASQVSGMLGVVAKTALKANGVQTGRRGTTNKEIMDFITVNADGVAVLNHRFNLVKHPVQTPDALSTSIALAAGVITGTINGLEDGTVIAKAILVYDRINDNWLSQSALDTAKTVSIGVTGALTDYDVYLYGIGVIPTTAEGRARLANLISQDAAGNYKVSPNRLDSTNFGYTRMLHGASIGGVAQNDSEPADPAATERRRQAAIKTLLLGMSEELQNAINIGLLTDAVAKGITVNNDFADLNNDGHIVTGTYDHLVVEYPDLILSKGRVTTIAPGEADYDTPLQVTVAIDDGYISELDHANDIVYLVVYSKTSQQAVMGSAHRDDDQVTVTVPGYWQGDFVETYIFVKDSQTEDTSDSVYCGSGRIA